MKRIFLALALVLAIPVAAYAAARAFPDGIILGNNESGKPARNAITGFYTYVTPSSVAYSEIATGLNYYEFTLTNVDYAHTTDEVIAYPLNPIDGMVGITALVLSEGTVRISYLVKNSGAAYTPFEDQWLLNITRTASN